MTEAQQQPQEVKRIGEFEYDASKLLGKGAWGEVFRGRQESLNRSVAIKILKKELTSDPEFVKRFAREAETLAKMTDEHIIQVYSAGMQDGAYYFIMEFVQGEPLSKFIEKGRKFEPNEIVYIGESVTRALKAAWESPAKIVHRDIKPSNIMVSFSSSLIRPPSAEKTESSTTEAGGAGDASASMMQMRDVSIMESKIKVMDFGLAKLSENVDGEATMAGTVIGTPKYISPEQGMGNAADIRSDIYSLGIVMYEMATGRIPFESDSAMSMIRHHIYDSATLPSEYNPDIPEGIESIIMKCIHKNPENRYETPQQLIEDFESYRQQNTTVHASSAAIEATMVSDFIGGAKRRSKLLYIGIGAASLVLLGVVYLALMIIAPQVLPSFLRPSRSAALGIELDEKSEKMVVDINIMINNDSITTAWESYVNLDTKYQSNEKVIALKDNLVNTWYNKVFNFIVQDDLPSAWDEYKKIPEVLLQDSYKLDNLKNEIADKWAEKITALIEEEENLEAAWDEFDLISDALLEISEDLVKLKDENLSVKWEKKMKFVLIGKFLEEKTGPFTGTLRTKNIESDFNATLTMVARKNYSKAYDRIDNAFIYPGDTELIPSATYFKMKLILKEKKTTYLHEMKKLLTELEDEYPSSESFSLAQTVFDDAKTAYQDERFNDYLTQIEKRTLNAQLTSSNTFKQECQKDIYLAAIVPKVVNKINEIQNNILRKRFDTYKKDISKIESLLKTSTNKSDFITAAQNIVTLKRDSDTLSSDIKNFADREEDVENLVKDLESGEVKLVELRTNIELGYLSLCDVEPVGEERIDSLHSVIKCTIDNAEMALIPSGDFVMGDDYGPFDARPSHKVTVKEFYIDRYEITNAQFAEFVQDTSHKTDAEKSGKGWVWKDAQLKEVQGANWRNPEGDGKGITDRMNHPVVQISWEDAEAYAQWAGKRLPTEAEWEKAARTNIKNNKIADQRRYPWGDEWKDDYCNYIVTGPGSTVAVNTFEEGKSHRECYHMAGNVSEWCSDWYNDKYYQELNINDNPKGPSKGKSHVLRGGSWVLVKKWLEVTSRMEGRFGTNNNFWSNYIGFRCVKDVDKELLPHLVSK